MKVLVSRYHPRSVAAVAPPAMQTLHEVGGGAKDDGLARARTPSQIL